jgi:type I restriction enzyme M protein
MRFDVVVANPPFQPRQVGRGDAAEADRYNRFWRGIPPKSKGDYAFITHMIEIAKRRAAASPSSCRTACCSAAAPKAASARR